MRIPSLAAMLAAAWLMPAVAMAVPPAAASASSNDRFTVRVEGQGPDVILVPGLASGPSVWKATVDQLKATRRVHVLHVSGFDGAPAGANAKGEVARPLAEQLARYIATQKLKAPAVIGHSFGGTLALMLAARHPASVGRVMVVDASPFYSLLLDPAATADGMKPRAAGFRDIMLNAPAAQVQAMQTATIARLVKTASARPAVVAAAGSSDRSVVAQATYDIMTTDLRPELTRIRAPLTVVYAYDPVYGIPAPKVDENFRAVYAGVPSARFVRIDDSYHFVMIDQPAPFAKAITTFLAN
jgi:pimeloyl-ACP methyl ester carboxylesterase